MKALLQRVREAHVVVEGETVGRIGAGLLVLVCAEPQDDEATGVFGADMRVHLVNDGPVTIPIDMR